MISRRSFLSKTGGVLFVGCTCGGLAPVAAQTGKPRREIKVDGKRVRFIDFHAHCIVPAIADVIKGTALDRPLPRSQIIVQNRLDAMDQRGIDTQVLSINQFWWYGAERELAEKIVSANDEGLVGLCEAHPGRFLALSSPALQFPDLAAAQLERALRLGLKGVSVGGHVNGEVPSSEKFDPFWAKAEELGVPVFIHPNSAENVTRPDAWKGRGDLANIIGNPLETTIFLTKLIFDGTLDRFPNLKIIGAHGAGYLPSYLERTEVACEVRDGANCLNKKRPSEYLKTQIYADSMVFSEEGVHHLVAQMGAGQIVYGSDMPFAWPDTADHIVNLAGISAADKEAMLGGTAARLLKLS
jgi:aminocarboxymuconate-semialdehyde decarboxylase